MDLRLRGSWRRQLLSPALLTLHRALVPRLRAHARGRMLDVGCGVMPFRRYVDSLVDQYEGVDREPRLPDVKFVADAQDMPAVRSGAYDIVLCSQVLEHVRRPARALGEMHRVLRSGGTLVLTVPFLSRLHEEPHDYFRFTEHALRDLLESQGFEILEVSPAGAMFSLLGHQVSTLLVGLTWGVPLIRHLAFWLNAIACTLPCAGLDRLIERGGKLPLNYVAVARRK